MISVILKIQKIKENLNLLNLPFQFPSKIFIMEQSSKLSIKCKKLVLSVKELEQRVLKILNPANNAQEKDLLCEMNKIFMGRNSKQKIYVRFAKVQERL
jgi:hypothetical protein